MVIDRNHLEKNIFELLRLAKRGLKQDEYLEQQINGMAGFEVSRLVHRLLCTLVVSR